MTQPEALIAARRAQAAEKHDRALKALREMVRSRERITFTSVALRAGVSREYLYRTPDLAERIRETRDARPLQPADSHQRSVVAALRDHVRRLEARHREELRALHEENARLRRERESLLGQLLTQRS